VAYAVDPIRVGMSMALTGGVAPIGKQVLTALQIWRDDINAKGGLLGRLSLLKNISLGKRFTIEERS
jgi:ABC-type branched-subunit amino acid transport system substrate-binding protein